MSSPITAKKKGRVDEALIAVHQRLSHGRRIELLAQRIAGMIRERHPAGDVRCLDVGCGDMRLAERVTELAPGTVWSCIDIHELPAGQAGDPRWKKYRRFDGTHIPFPGGSFDVVLFCDVLHHAQENAPLLLDEAGRAGRAVIIKDHFEYSLFSRMMLWGMDFLGNWGYGVALPRRYFTRERFSRLAEQAGLRIERVDAGIDLYSHLPVLRSLLRPSWQFTAVLTRK